MNSNEVPSRLRLLLRERNGRPARQLLAGLLNSASFDAPSLGWSIVDPLESTDVLGGLDRSFEQFSKARTSETYASLSGRGVLEAVQEFLTQQQDDSQAWQIRLNEAETIGILFTDSSSIVKITESLLFFEENAFFAVRADRYCGFHLDVGPDGIFELTVWPPVAARPD